MILGQEESGRKSGVIVGGLVLAGQKIRAQNVGSNASIPTQLVAGVDLNLLKKMSDLQKQINRDQSMMNRILSLLNLESPDLLKVKELILRLKGIERKKALVLGRELIALLTRNQKTSEEKKEREEEVQEVAFAATIEVLNKVFRDTTVRIGGQNRTFKEDTTGIKVSLVEKEEGDRELKITPL